MVTLDRGDRDGQGGVPRNEGSSLMAPSHKVSSSPGGVVGTAIRPQSVGTLPTKNGRAKFRFLLNQQTKAISVKACTILLVLSPAFRVAPAVT